MNREDCWMTFSEALEKYLQAREAARHFGEGRNRNDALQEMKEAAEHMDALTSLPPNGEVRGASRPAGEASSAEGATSTAVLERDDNGGNDA